MDDPSKGKRSQSDSISYPDRETFSKCAGWLESPEYAPDPNQSKEEARAARLRDIVQQAQAQLEPIPPRASAPSRPSTFTGDAGAAARHSLRPSEDNAPIDTYYDDGEDDYNPHAFAPHSSEEPAPTPARELEPITVKDRPPPLPILVRSINGSAWVETQGLQQSVIAAMGADNSDFVAPKRRERFVREYNKYVNDPGYISPHCNNCVIVKKKPALCDLPSAKDHACSQCRGVFCSVMTRTDEGAVANGYLPLEEPSRAGITWGEKWYWTTVGKPAPPPRALSQEL